MPKRDECNMGPVSYTHLDVYKRQIPADIQFFCQKRHGFKFGVAFTFLYLNDRADTHVEPFSQCLLRQVLPFSLRPQFPCK